MRKKRASTKSKVEFNSIILYCFQFVAISMQNVLSIYEGFTQYSIQPFQKSLFNHYGLKIWYVQNSFPGRNTGNIRCFIK